MLGVEIIGPVHGPTGYDRHTREFTRHLHGLGVPVHLSPLVGWSPALPSWTSDPFLQECMQPRATDVALHFTMPHHGTPRPGKRNVNYTMFEGCTIPPDWARRAFDHDLIVVPTPACAEAWTASGVPADRVRVSPLGVDGDFFSAVAEPLPLAAGGREVATIAHRFLHLSELRPRKNLLGLLRTWIRATSKDDDAVLLVKSMSFDPADEQAFAQDVAIMQQQLGRSFADSAPIMLLRGFLDETQMRSLYRSASHYISLSHGEGWDLAMMEAGAAGLQLIAPAHSGYLSYLTEQDALLIPSTRCPAVFEGQAGRVDSIFFEGIDWWRPDEDAATAIVRSVVQGDAPKPSPQQRILRDYTWPRAAASLRSILENL